MVVYPGCFSEQNITADMNGLRFIRNPLQSVLVGKSAFGYRAAFYQRVVFTVGNDWHIQPCRNPHRIFHHLGALYAYTVIREANRSSLF
ncbi:hypothetical protein D3C81_1881720 [compost metagenome]